MILRSDNIFNKCLNKMNILHKRLKVFFLLTLSSIIGSEISMKGSFTVEILKKNKYIKNFR